MGVSRILFKNQDSKILAIQCGREFLTYNTEFNAGHDKSIRSFMTCSVCLLMVGSVCVWASKLSFKAFLSRRSSLTQTFVESCVDFEVAHLSVIIAYPER